MISGSLQNVSCHRVLLKHGAHLLEVSQEGGATDKDPVPASHIRQRVAETTERLGTVPDLFLIHNRKP
jgi:aryl-alcohol dehydrogenase-like predicted oxidoreductase